MAKSTKIVIHGKKRVKDYLQDKFTYLPTEEQLKKRLNCKN